MSSCCVKKWLFKSTPHNQPIENGTGQIARYNEIAWEKVK